MSAEKVQIERGFEGCRVVSARSTFPFFDALLNNVLALRASQKHRESKKAIRAAFTTAASVANNCELPLSVIPQEARVKRESTVVRSRRLNWPAVGRGRGSACLLTSEAADSLPGRKKRIFRKSTYQNMRQCELIC